MRASCVLARPLAGLSDDIHRAVREEARRDLDDAGKFDEQAVAGGFDEAAAMLGDPGIDELASMGSEPAERARFDLPNRRLYPTTSAVRMAASRRSTRSSFTASSPTGAQSQVCAAGGR